MAVKPAREGLEPIVQRLGALRRVVRDLAASVAFYRHGLGFRVVGDLGAAPMRDVVVLALGDERIELVAAHTSVRWPPPAEAPGSRFQHVAIVASDIKRAYDQLQSVAPVPISRGGPQQLPQSSGGVRAFKFRDPDGHPLELIEFPLGVGDRRWHSAQARREGSPTLGIDHAAICVTEAERSIAFYAQFGFTLVARQRNVGAEQARLDGLDRSEVEVIALRPAGLSGASGPHLELLAYLTPRPLEAKTEKSRSAPQVTQDRLVWQVANAPAPGLRADPDGHLNEFVASIDQAGIARPWPKVSQPASQPASRDRAHPRHPIDLQLGERSPASAVVPPKTSHAGGMPPRARFFKTRGVPPWYERARPAHS